MEREISWFNVITGGAIALFTVFQIGLTGLFMYTLLNGMFSGLSSINAFVLLLVALMIVVDLWLARWLLRYAEQVVVFLEGR